MSLHPLAGKPAPKELLVNVPRLMAAYYAEHPQAEVKDQRVSFGTSGHRGSSLQLSFNEDHIVATTQAICEHRRAKGIDGPLFLGMDTHALSEAAWVSALEVLAGNGVTVMIDRDRGFTPTPAISHAILTKNRGGAAHKADGIVITPSHNPPEDGGFKYNPPHGGPAEEEITKWIEDRANELLAAKLSGVTRIPVSRALSADTTLRHDFISSYVHDLASILDLRAVSGRKLRIGVDPMGGAAIAYWNVIAEHFKLDLTVVNDAVDPRFSFMSVDKDGKIRMDCSSPHAMAGLVKLKDRFDVAFGNDTDVDRHGIVTKSVGLMNPNHYLAVAIQYLFENRPTWRPDAAVGKTLVSSSMIDRVARSLSRRLAEVPVGFKWFVGGLLDGSYGFGGEESAGASFLRRDGGPWTTDKDGIVLGLLAAEITAAKGRDPGELYQTLTKKYGEPVYERIDAPANPEEKARLKKLTAEKVTATELGGERIVAKLTHAPENNAPIGGLKVVTENGWFAARPSGTEDVYKIYTESFRGREHLERIQEEARAIVTAAIKG